jgi:hypothetical protein
MRRRKDIVRTARNVLALAAVGLALGCGGSGGDGGGGGATHEVRGTAVAPRPTAVTAGAVVPTLEPVVGANVFAFEIDRAGNPTGPLLARATTDGAGGFVLKSAGELTGDVIVQVTYEAGPVPVGPAGGNLNSLITGEDLYLDPGAEQSTREIVNQLRSVHDDRLSYFTSREAASFISLWQTVLENDPGLLAPSIDETVRNLDDSQSPEVITDVLDGLDEPGQAAIPSGVFRFVDYTAGFDAEASRSANLGTLTILDDGTATLVSNGVHVRRDSTCGGSPCERSFTTTQEPTTVGIAGRVTAAENGFLLFSFPGPTGALETTLGSVTADGEVIVFTVHTGGRLGMRVALRDTPVLAINGDYGFAQQYTNFPADGPATDTWPTVTHVLAYGQMTFDPMSGVYGGAIDSHPMHMDVSCSGPGCRLNGTVSPPGGSAPSFTPFGGAFAPAPGGGLLLNDGVVTHAGYVSPSQQVFALQRLSPAGDSLGLLVGTRMGTGKSNASLVGDYNFTQVEDLLNGPGATIQGDARTGIARFDGQGGLGLLGGAVGNFRADCAGGACGNALRLINYDTFESSGGYAVDPTGNVAMTVIAFGPSFPLFGTLSDDGNVLVIHHRRDLVNPSVGLRVFAVATKQRAP